ncbi:MAG: flagellar hook-basal body complex protein FliE [Pseudomonadota bacterium]
MDSISLGAVQLMQDMQKMASATRLSEMSGLSTNNQDGVQGASSVSFAELLKNSLSQVNAAQNTATTLQTSYETGAGNVDLSDVMVAMQKASLSLQMVQNVRGRLVSAYQELINTPL